MTIDEAIAQLNFLEIRFQEQKLVDKAEALKLGIEALKREKARRGTKRLNVPDLLPGETEK